MNTKPIIFSAPMIHALLREIEQPGTGKTQTRRIVKPQPELVDGAWYWKHPRYDNGGGADYFHTIHISPSVLDNMAECAPWQPGDLLWARETHGYPAHGYKERQRELAEMYGCWYRATDRHGSAMIHGPMCSLHWCGRWRPSIFMPRWASRLTLLVEEVRVQRVQDISEEDAKAEGCNPYMPGEGIIEPPTHPDEHQYRPDYWRGFSVLWDSLNAKRGYGWDANPWVWALTFKPILANVDAVLAEPERYGVAA